MKLVQLKGLYLKKVLEEGLSKAELVLGSFPVVSRGVKVVFDYNKNPLSRVISFTLNGKEIDDEKMYNVVTTQFLSSGGDGYVSFKNSIPTDHERNMSSMFQVVKEYVINHSENLQSFVEGRIEAV